MAGRCGPHGVGLGEQGTDRGPRWEVSTHWARCRGYGGGRGPRGTDTPTVPYPCCLFEIREKESKICHIKCHVCGSDLVRLGSFTARRQHGPMLWQDAAPTLHALSAAEGSPC